MIKRILKWVFLGIISIFILCSLVLGYLIIGNPIVAYHNYQLKKAVLSAKNERKVTLNEIVPFKWDKVYTFGPYTTKSFIEDEIGIKSNSIHDSDSDIDVYVIFVNKNKVTASVCSLLWDLCYDIQFDGCVTYDENAVFSVEKVDFPIGRDVIYLSKQ